MCSVGGVCVHTYIHTRTLSPASKIGKTLISPPVENKPPRQQATSDLHRLAETPHPRAQTQMTKLRIHWQAHVHTSDCGTHMHADVNLSLSKHLNNIHSRMQCTSAQDTCGVNATINAKKCAYTCASTPVRWFSNFVAIPTLMMMIAFITFKSSLVSLIQGPYSSNSLACGFEFMGFRRNQTRRPRD